MHRYLSVDVGKEHVRTLISQALAVMGGYDIGEWRLFIQHWEKIHPRDGQQLVIENNRRELVSLGQMGFCFE